MAAGVSSILITVAIASLTYEYRENADNATGGQRFTNAMSRTKNRLRNWLKCSGPEQNTDSKSGENTHVNAEKKNVTKER